MKSVYFPVFDIARMMLDDFASQHIAVDVCVDFGCSNRFVSQHALDGTQVGSAFQQVGCKGMAEGVRADVLVILACCASSFIMWKIIIRESLLPLRRLIKTKSSCPLLTSI